MTAMIYTESFKYIAAIFLDKGQQQISRGSLIYEIDIGFDTQGHRMREKKCGHWVRDLILVQKYGELGENVLFGLSVRAVLVQ